MNINYLENEIIDQYLYDENPTRPMKIDATISISMVDACHIIPFRESFDDTISNGIALCPNLHRAFDRGLITIPNDFKVVVSQVFNEMKTDYSIKKLKISKLYFHGKLSTILHWQT